MYQMHYQDVFFTIALAHLFIVGLGKMNGESWHKTYYVYSYYIERSGKYAKYMENILL